MDIIEFLKTAAQFDAPSGPPLHAQVRQAILHLIEAGDLGPGDALPSERHLAEGLGISRVTVRKAVADLADDGVLSRRHGSGTYVTPKIDRPQSKPTGRAHHDTGHTIVADIGGTNARFARLDADNRPTEVCKLPTPDFADLCAAVAAYIGEAGGPEPRNLVVAIAGPIAGDTVALTNGTWQFSRTELQARMGLDALHVLNDFEALALSLPHLSSRDLIQIGGPRIEAHGGNPPKAVIGPGTGLGMCGLVDAGERWIPVPTEGGHTSLAPATERELEVWRFARKRHGRVSAERLLSGHGLIELHHALASLAGHNDLERKPEEIVELALEGNDPVAVESLSMFCAWLGDRAGDLALMFNAYGGIYLAGGLLGSIPSFLRDSDFRDRFDTKGRGNAVASDVPTYLITEKYPALIGCASMLS